jgi:YegS/Rv2252/BmrU family lipid kinase
MNSGHRRKIRFIFNPKAGHGFGAELQQRVANEFDPMTFKVACAETVRAGHATELATQALHDGFDTVVAVGGDGTINEVARTLAGTNVALGILPTGSGNGFARYFKIPESVPGALAVIRQGRQVRVDSMEVNGRFGINIAGAGFDAYIADLFSRQPTRGVLTYMKLVLREYFGYRMQDYRITFGDRQVEGPALLVAFANGTQFGNDALIAPTADPCDGMLDLVILRKAPWYLVPGTLRRLYKGTLCSGPYTECHRVRTAVLTTRLPVYAHIDGEPLPPLQRLEVRVHPGSNRLLVPGG